MKRADTLPLVIIVTAAALGALCGYTVARARVEPLAPTPDFKERGAADSAIQHRVVYRYKESPESASPPDNGPTHGEDADDGLADQAYLWCTQQLMQCEERANFRRAEWPDDSPAEMPEKWAEVISDALEGCNSPLSLTLVECSEYPCVAVLATGLEPADKAQVEKLEGDMRAALSNCPVLQRELQSDNIADLVHIFKYDVICADGRQQIVLGVAASPRNSILSDAMENAELEQLLRWYYRRAEDVASAWKCE